MKDNLTVLAGDGQTIPIQEALRALKEIVSDMPAYVEYTKLVAEMAKVRYDEYISAGFDENQAIELCRHLA